MGEQWNVAGGPMAPARRAALVTPADGADLDFVTRGISFAAAGALKITTVGGDTLIIPSGALAAGIMHPIFASRIWATGTAATGIVAWW